MKKFLWIIAGALLASCVVVYALDNDGVEQIQSGLPRIEFYDQINETVCDLVDQANSFQTGYITYTGTITTVSFENPFDSTNNLVVVPFYNVTAPNVITAVPPLSVTAVTSNGFGFVGSTNGAYIAVGIRNKARE